MHQILNQIKNILQDKKIAANYKQRLETISYYFHMFISKTGHTVFTNHWM